MKTAVFFVILQFLLGLGFAIAGVFLFAKYDTSSMDTSILLSFLIGFFCMLVGVGLPGYFHLKIKHTIDRLGKAVMMSFAGLFVFLILYIFIESFLPSYLGILSLFIPLSGAVFGFNFVVTKNADDK